MINKRSSEIFRHEIKFFPQKGNLEIWFEKFGFLSSQTQYQVSARGHRPTGRLSVFV